MSARDVFHNQAKNAPKNADWHVTNDPFSFRIGREPFHIDLGDCRMDRMKQQQESVTQLITRFASYKPAFGDVEMQAITDHEHGHYQVMSIGWEKDERSTSQIFVCAPSFHTLIQLRRNRMNGTEHQPAWVERSRAPRVRTTAPARLPRSAPGKHTLPRRG